MPKLGSARLFVMILTVSNHALALPRRNWSSPVGPVANHEGVQRYNPTTGTYLVIGARRQRRLDAPDLV